MRHFLLPLAIVLLLFPSFVWSQPISNQSWQTATISSGAITIDCADLLLPFELGRLLSEPNPTTERGEMDESLRSSHATKVKLQPETGTSDTLTTISGCTQDGAMVMLGTADVGDSVTVAHTDASIELVDDEDIVLGDPTKIITLIRKDSVWVSVGGGGSGGGFGKTVSGLDGESNAFIFKDSNNDGFKVYCDTSGCVFECVLDIGGTETACTPSEIKTATITPSIFSPDESLCEHVTSVTLNVQKIPVAITCDDDDAAEFEAVIAMPDRWDGSTLVVYSFLHTAETTPAGDIFLDWGGYCVENGSLSGHNNFPTETTDGEMLIDLDAHTQHDVIITPTTGNIPLDNCGGTGKKVLHLRAQVDATLTTADDSGTNPALDDQYFIQFQIEYGLSAYTD